MVVIKPVYILSIVCWILCPPPRPLRYIRSALLLPVQLHCHAKRQTSDDNLGMNSMKRSSSTTTKRRLKAMTVGVGRLGVESGAFIGFPMTFVGNEWSGVEQIAGQFFANIFRGLRHRSGWLAGWFAPRLMSIYAAFNTSTPIFCSSRPQQNGQSRGHGKRLVSMMMRSPTWHDLHNNNSVVVPPPLSLYLISSSSYTLNNDRHSKWQRMVLICTWDDEKYEWVGGGCIDLLYCGVSWTMCVFIETTKTENDSSPLESIRN